MRRLQNLHTALGVNKQNFSNDVGKTVLGISNTESSIMFYAEVDFDLVFSWIWWNFGVSEIFWNRNSTNCPKTMSFTMLDKTEQQFWKFDGSKIRFQKMQFRSPKYDFCNNFLENLVENIEFCHFSHFFPDMNSHRDLQGATVINTSSWLCQGGDCVGSIYKYRSFEERPHVSNYCINILVLE